MEIDTRKFYRKTITEHRFLQDAIADTVEDDSIQTADLVMTGPPIGGEDSDLEIEDDDNIMPEQDMPHEVAGEIDVICPELEDSDIEEETDRRDYPMWKKVDLTAREKFSAMGSEKYAAKNLLNVNQELAMATEWEIFMKTFDPCLELLTSMTNMYAKRERNCPNFNVDKQEMLRFLGIILLSGYNIRSNERDFWSTSKDLECPLVAETMSRNRFSEIKKFLHSADNSALCCSKMAKVLPLYTCLNKSLIQYGVIHEDLSIDESMVPYYGHHSCKQFIRGKPIRFGYKLWMLASSSGMPYQVHIYEGKELVAANNKDSLGTRVVKKCLSVCTDPEKHHIYFDNFFTSYNLIKHLKKAKFRATGTVRSNRTNKCPINNQKLMKKCDRGSYDYRSDGEVEIITWHDNVVVSFCSNAEGVHSLGQAKRYVKGKGKIQVTQPYVVKSYNIGMGGVDLTDRALSEYRPRIRGKKWYFPLIINALNLAVVHSWRLYCVASEKTISNKEFRRTLVSIMTKRSSDARAMSSTSRPGPKSSLLPSELRTDNINHHPVSLVTPRRCVVCKKNCKIKCQKCDKSLHLHGCFQSFHEL